VIITEEPVDLWTRQLASIASVTAVTLATPVALKPSAVGADVSDAAGSDFGACCVVVSVLAVADAVTAETVPTAEYAGDVVWRDLHGARGGAIRTKVAAVAEALAIVRAAESVAAANARSRASVGAVCAPEAVRA
jgi:hypothetical protein